MGRNRLELALYMTTALSMVLSAPVRGQQAAPGTSSQPATGAQPATGNHRATHRKVSSSGSGAPEEVVVTARRRAERLQRVPISISVVNQATIKNLNIVNAGDLATYTPSLQSNARFGAENTSFAIRGFVQDAETSPSVGVYFDDVVALRGAANGVTGGDTAPAGSFFDLQNVQVLKGPQGTLFGRNTTGGAVLLVPQRPTSVYGGYLETSYGNYGMKREQGVINIPITDNLRFRAGVDYESRDGYMNNTTGIGPSHYNNVDYVAPRASLVWDITPDIESYTVATYSRSENNGQLPHTFACNQTNSLAGAFLCPNFAAQNGAGIDKFGYLNSGKNNFYDGTGVLTNPDVVNEQYQLINTTSWSLLDNLTVKNIVSYGEFRSTYASSVFGESFQIPNIATFGPLAGERFFGVVSSPVPDVGNSGSESTATEELQFQGNLFNNRFTWQAGGYLADSEPLGQAGSDSPLFATCSGVVNSTDCRGALPGVLPSNYDVRLAQQDYHDVAGYGQGTYKITHYLSLTGGIRYSVDDTHADALQSSYPENPLTGAFLPGPVTCTTSKQGGIFVPPNNNINACNQSLEQKSHAPTWLVDLDYTPTDTILGYVKYARGYRQGGVNAFGPDLNQTFNQEKVDSFELGGKTSFRGPVPGTFDFAAFYNNFTNQQLQTDFIPSALGAASGVSPNASPLNAGKSIIKGFEISSTLRPFHNFIIDASYTFLFTKLGQAAAFASGDLYNTPIPTARLYGPLELSPKNKFAITGTYALPVDRKFGTITGSMTVSYTSSQICYPYDPAEPAISEPYGVLPPLTLVNLSANWNRIYSSPFDASFFITNLTDKKYYTYISGAWSSFGFESGEVGEPRMIGGRLRYHFGG